MKFSYQQGSDSETAQPMPSFLRVSAPPLIIIIIVITGETHVRRHMTENGAERGHQVQNQPLLSFLPAFTVSTASSSF